MDMIWREAKHEIKDFNKAKRRARERVKESGLWPDHWRYHITRTDILNSPEHLIVWKIKANYCVYLEEDGKKGLGTWISLEWCPCASDWQGVGQYRVSLTGLVGDPLLDKRPYGGNMSNLDEKLEIMTRDIPKVLEAISLVIDEMNPDTINQLVKTIESMGKKTRRKETPVA